MQAASALLVQEELLKEAVEKLQMASVHPKHSRISFLRIPALVLVGNDGHKYQTTCLLEHQMRTTVEVRCRIPKMMTMMTRLPVSFLPDVQM